MYRLSVCRMKGVFAALIRYTAALAAFAAFAPAEVMAGGSRQDSGIRDNVLMAQAAAAKSGGSVAGPSSSRVSPDLDALIKAAKVEGVLTFYWNATEDVAQRMRDVFNSKYGIKSQFIRFNSPALIQRFSSEADSNSNVPDMVFLAGDAAKFASDWLKRGFVESISTAGIPAIKSGEYPARWLRGNTAVVQIGIWGISYNTEKLGSAEVPRDWPDLLNPSLKGQLLITNPAASPTYIDFWLLALDKYGPDFFTKLRAQNPRIIAGGVPAIQALAAGEGMVQVPAQQAQVKSMSSKGAPIARQPLDLTTGIETQIILMSRSKAKSPNAARLLANFLMTREGNPTVTGEDDVTIFDTNKLPKQYSQPSVETPPRTAEVMKLLGL